MRSIKHSALLCLLYLASTTAAAWWDIGHELVAQIAYTQLTPEAKQQVDELRAQLYQEYPDIKQFTDLATWPDKLRQNKIETFTHWHYIDIPFSADETPLVNTIDTDNAVTMLKQIKLIVANKTLNPFERARFLAFLIHIVGDLHQPLHTVSRISKEHRNGDEGGNLFLIVNPSPPHQLIPLHALWDSDFGTFRKEAEPDLNQLTESLMSDFPPDYFADRALDLSLEHWSQEGVSLAKEFVYNTSENKTPDTPYVDQGKKLAEERIALSGYRLANLLNKLLGKGQEDVKNFSERLTAD